jgi:hypothetical protein
MGYEVRLSRDGEAPWVLEELSTDRIATLDSPPLGHWQAWVRSVDVERRKSRPAHTAVLYDDSADVRQVGEIVGLRIEGSADGFTSESADFRLAWDYREPGAALGGEVASAPSNVATFVIEAWDMRAGGLLWHDEVGLTQRAVYSIDRNRSDQVKLGRASPAREVRFRVWARGITGEDGKIADLYATNPARPAPAEVVYSATGAPAASGTSKGMIHAEIVQSGEAVRPSDEAGWAIWGSTSPGFTPSPENLILATTKRGFDSFPADPAVTLYLRLAQLDTFDGDAASILDPDAELNLTGEEAVTPADFVFAEFPVETEDIAPDAVTEYGTFEVVGPGSQDIEVDASGGKISVVVFGQFGVSAGVPMNALVLVLRHFYPAAVLYYNGSSYLDRTAEAVSEGAGNDVEVPNVAWVSEATSPALYVGNEFPWLDPARRLEVVQDGSGYTSTTSTFEFDYWDGSAWVPVSMTDTTSGCEQSGYWEFAAGIPADWAPRTVNGVGPYFWIRVRQTQNPAGSNLQVRYLKTEHDLAGGSTRAIARAQEGTTLSIGITLLRMDVADVAGTKATETLRLTTSATGASVRGKAIVHVGKDHASP